MSFWTMHIVLDWNIDSNCRRESALSICNFQAQMIMEVCVSFVYSEISPGMKGVVLIRLFLVSSTGPELWTVYRVWWGNKKSMAKSDLTGVAGVNVFNTLHPVRSLHCILCCRQNVYASAAHCIVIHPFSCAEKTLYQWLAPHLNTA